VDYCRGRDRLCVRAYYYSNVDDEPVAEDNSLGDGKPVIDDVPIQTFCQGGLYSPTGIFSIFDATHRG
jgi:hypothetical protein